MVTKLIIIRHGQPLSDGYADDALKPLSKEGRNQILNVLNILKGAKPKIILTSPLLRAVQSAELVSEVLGGPCQEEPALGPEFKSDVILDHLPSPEHEETVVIVGHMPSLLDLAVKLVGKQILPEGIAKGSAVILEFPDRIGWGQAQLVKYIHP